MPQFVITSPSDSRIAVRIGSCDSEHAASVLRQLMDYSGFPSDLRMEELPDPDAPPKPWWRRTF